MRIAASKPVFSRRFLAVLAGALMLITALAGCSVNPATGEQSFTAFMSPADEIKVGSREHPKLVEQFGGSCDDKALDAYVKAVGARLAAVTEIPDLPYSFTLLNDEKINAFALPGGFVHITRGLLALADSEAEMAGVLAHELGHITARHTAERYSRAMATQLGLAVLGVVGAAAGVPSEAGNLAAFGAQAWLQGFSREQELEADMLGIRYMTRAGYDPAAMASFFRKMDEFTRLQATLSGDPDAADRFSIMASHPRTGDRVAQALQLTQGTRPQNARIGRDDYLSRLDGILFGDHPDQGVRVGRDFLHPGLRIAFRVPPGFVMFNDPRQVVARGPDGAIVVFDAAPAKDARAAGNLPAYVGRTWGGKVGIRNVEAIRVNGMDGATGQTRAQTKSGVRDVRLVAIREAPDRLYRFIFITKPEQTGALTTELQRTTYSFRRLSEAEARAIKPLRVRVIDVRRGDTIGSLAARMPFDQYRQERFLALNGIAPNERLAPGRRVKIVVQE